MNFNFSRDGSSVFLRRDAIAAGVGDRALARLVRSGELHKVKHGAYVDGDLWAKAGAHERHLLLARAAFRVARHEVALSHVSAVVAHTHGYWGLPLDEAHLTRLDSKAGRINSGVRQHRGLVLPGDVVEREGLACIAPARAALELSTIVDAERALVVVNSFLHAGLCTIEDMRSRYEHSIHRWQGTLATDLVLRLADQRIESVGETRAFWLLRRLGMPKPELQYPVRDSHGNVIAIVDFAWPELGLFIEFDGKIKYGKLLREGESASDVVVREKRREDLVRRITGWRCLRLVWADLERPERVRKMIHEILAQDAVA